MTKNGTIPSPIAFAGQRVIAQGHKGAPRAGTIRRVQTHYSRKANEPYHIYAIQFDGNRRDQHLGEDAILKLLPATP